MKNFQVKLKIKFSIDVIRSLENSKLLQVRYGSTKGLLQYLLMLSLSEFTIPNVIVFFYILGNVSFRARRSLTLSAMKTGKLTP